MKKQDIHLYTTVDYNGGAFIITGMEPNDMLVLLPEDGLIPFLAPMSKVSGIPITHEILSRSFGNMNSNLYTYTDDTISVYIYERCPNSWVVSCDRAVDSEYFEQVIVQYMHELEVFLEHVGYIKFEE